MIESLDLFLLTASGLVLLSVLMSPLAIRLGAPILLNRAQCGMRCFWMGSAPEDFRAAGAGAV